MMAQKNKTKQKTLCVEFYYIREAKNHYLTVL